MQSLHEPFVLFEESKVRQLGSMMVPKLQKTKHKFYNVALTFCCGLPWSPVVPRGLPWSPVVSRGLRNQNTVVALYGVSKTQWSPFLACFVFPGRRQSEVV